MPTYDELYQRGRALLLNINSDLNKISKEHIRISPDLAARKEDVEELCVALALQEWVWEQGQRWAQTNQK